MYSHIHYKLSCSSEDESGAHREPRVASTRRGGRFRRRRAMPIHCITLQHPTVVNISLFTPVIVSKFTLITLQATYIKFVNF